MFIGIFYYYHIVRQKVIFTSYQFFQYFILFFSIALVVYFYNSWLCIYFSPLLIKYGMLPTQYYNLFALEYFVVSTDVSIIPFILMLLVCIISIYYCVQFTTDNLFKFFCYLGLIIISGYIFITTKLLLLFFISYEMLLIPTCIMLFLFTKTTRGRTAVRTMILWTQSGAVILFLILYCSCNFQILGTLDSIIYTNNRTFLNIFVLCLFFCFGTKIPVWPFFWWLPEAHVEVSTHFSIVLSGVSIKFAFIGLWRFLNIYGAGDVYWICVCLCVYGLFSALFQIDVELDLKKIVALLTVVEMHIFCIFLFIDASLFADFITLALTTHCWLSSLQFILVDIITRRYASRNIEHLYGIVSGSPLIVKCVFIVVFIFGSIPGTNVFMVEMCMQLYASLVFCGFILVFCLQFISIIWSKQTWWLLWGGDIQNNATYQFFNLTRTESHIILMMLVLLIVPFSCADLWLL